MTASFDVIVVGAGSAGGTIASRLSEDERCRVLLLEAGPDFPDEATRPQPWFVLGSLPGSTGPPLPSLDWGYVSEPVAEGGPPVPVPRGKLVGGSSMVNGTIAVRGRPEDFGRWVAAGATGWGWDDVLPFFEAVERELPVKTVARELWLPVQELFVQGCEEIGFRYVEDMNAPDAWDRVVGPWPRSRRNEVRQGSLVTYIRKARGRPNFTIRDGVHVDRVLLENGRAAGVAYVDADGSPQEARADRVVLSAGVYGSGPVLMRSGIGPADELRKLGIAPVADLPVGDGLFEHPGVRFRLSVEPTYAEVRWPHIAVVCRAVTHYASPSPVDEDVGLVEIPFFLATTDRPAGRVALRSPFPADPPLIDHAWATTIATGDFDEVWRDFQALLRTSPFTRARARDVNEGVPLDERLVSGMTAGTHAAGGCAIGRVVAPDLDVYGVEGLTVADASVFPSNISNNLNFTCHMVGEVAAARIRARV